MAVASELLVELKSSKAQLEVGLIYLRRKHAELQKLLARLEERRTHAGAASLLETQRQTREVAAEIARREAIIVDVVARIAAEENRARDDGIEPLLLANEAMGEELSALRGELLRCFRALAGPLQHYQELVERKTRVAKQIATRTGKDLAYANYIECALLRQSEYEDDLKAAVEIIKKLRVAS